MTEGTMWQPIETFTERNDAVLLLVNHYPMLGYGNQNKWYDNKGVKLDSIPTHWMPLPKPPRRERPLVERLWDASLLSEDQEVIEEAAIEIEALVAALKAMVIEYTRVTIYSPTLNVALTCAQNALRRHAK